MAATPDDVDAASPHHYSPSQIGNYQGCKRAWVFDSLLHLRGPQTRSQALGTAVHAQLERYLKGGDIDYMCPDQSGYIASAMLPILPPPIENLAVEKKFYLHSYKGFLYHGIKDYIWTPPGDLITVGDHKTSSNIAKYSKTVEDLHKDTQAIIYAYESLQDFRVGEVRLKWGYVQTVKPYKVKPVEDVVQAREITPKFLEIEETCVAPMSKLIPVHRLKKGVAASTDHVTRVVQEVAPTPSHCEAFGGCPYKAYCADVKPDDWRKNMSTTPQVPGTGADILAALRARALDNTTTIVNPPAATNILIPPPPPIVSAPVAPPVHTDPINPPVLAVAPPPALPAPQADTQPTEAPKRTRRTKAQIEADKAAATPAPLEHTEEPAVKQEFKAAEPVQNVGTYKHVTTGPSARIARLYIDCMPNKGDAAVNTALLMQDARRQVNAMLNVSDYRLKGFGEGQAIFAGAVALLAASGEFGTEFILDSHTAEGTLLVCPLSEIANEVVRSFR